MSVAGALILSMATIGAAQAVPDEADSTAALVAEAAPGAAKVVEGRQHGSGVVAASAGTRTEMPENPNDPLVLSDDVGELSVTLPEGANLGLAQFADDGTVVYPGEASGDIDVAVQKLDGGITRIQSVIPNAAASHEQTYSFGDEITPVLQDDGSVELRSATVDGDVSAVVGVVAAPWAVDANGDSVETHYRVEANSIVQVTEADERTAYPVVADPSVSFGWGVYLKYSRSEVRYVVNNAIASNSGSIASKICGVIPISWVSDACSAASSTMLKSMYATFVAANKKGQCVQVHVAGTIPVSWKGIRC